VKWSPDSILASIIIIGTLLLIGLGIDGEVKSILAGSAGWLFGGQYQIRRTTIKK